MKIYIGVLVLFGLIGTGIFFLIKKNFEGKEIVPVIESYTPDTIPSTKLLPSQDTFWTEPADTTQFAVGEDGYIPVSWKVLTKMKFQEKFSEEVQAYIPYPVFHPDVIYLASRKISVSGYVIPTDEIGEENLLVLSAYPYSNCFFCGGAGPESVMDIHFNKKPRKKFKMDEKTTFRGRLKLNASDLYYLNYILEDVRY